MLILLLYIKHTLVALVIFFLWPPVYSGEVVACCICCDRCRCRRPPFRLLWWPTCCDALHRTLSRSQSGVPRTRWTMDRHMCVSLKIAPSWALGVDIHTKSYTVHRSPLHKGWLQLFSVWCHRLLDFAILHSLAKSLCAAFGWEIRTETFCLPKQDAQNNCADGMASNTRDIKRQQGRHTVESELTGRELTGCFCVRSHAKALVLSTSGFLSFGQGHGSWHGKDPKSSLGAFDAPFGAQSIASYWGWKLMQCTSDSFELMISRLSMWEHWEYVGSSVFLHYLHCQSN